MTLYAYYESMPSQCGGYIVHDFQYYVGMNRLSLKEVKNRTEDSMIVATFNQYQKKEYKAFCKTFTWLCQSKPIKNPCSGNWVFTVVAKA